MISTQNQVQHTVAPGKRFSGSEKPLCSQQLKAFLRSLLFTSLYSLAFWVPNPRTHSLDSIESEHHSQILPLLLTGTRPRLCTSVKW